MNIKRNITANYLLQIYITLIGVLLIPIYIEKIGAQAFGMVGFFSLIQSWFVVLDLGLTPTISRETSRFFAGATSSLHYRRLLRALSILFFIVALLGGGALYFCSDIIAEHWLKTDGLAIKDVIFSIQIIAICVSLRWMGGLYRGVITGAERFVLLGWYMSIISTFRYVLVIGTMELLGNNLLVFFLHQLITAIVEFLGLLILAYKIVPTINKEKIGYSLKPILSLIKFSLTIAFTSAIWVFVTQTDKLILSGKLSLTEYGYFTLAVLVAGGMLAISGPVSNAIMPRMVSFYENGNKASLISLYRNSTQFISLLAGTIAILFVFCAEPLLFSWTGNISISSQAAPILRLYAAGNFMLCVGAFPYYLQYAKGSLRYHVVGNIWMLLLLVPVIIMMAEKFGAIGAGWAWLLINSLYLFVWVPFVHSKIEVELTISWLFADIILVVLPGIAVASAMVYIWSYEYNESRYASIFFCFIVTLAVFSSIIFSTPLFRNYLHAYIKRL